MLHKKQQHPVIFWIEVDFSELLTENKCTSQSRRLNRRVIHLPQQHQQQWLLNLSLCTKRCLINTNYINHNLEDSTWPVRSMFLCLLRRASLKVLQTATPTSWNGRISTLLLGRWNSLCVFIYFFRRRCMQNLSCQDFFGFLCFCHKSVFGQWEEIHAFSCTLFITRLVSKDHKSWHVKLNKHEVDSHW